MTLRRPPRSRSVEMTRQETFKRRIRQRVKITIAHDKLPTAEAVEEWKGYWADWLEAVDDA